MIAVAAAFLSIVGSPAAAGEIAWSADLPAALERAAAERKVVFLAVNMDGEGANERMARKVYRDRDVVRFAEATINLLASPADHGGGACSVFPGLACAQHRAVETAARAAVLKPDADGYVVAPMHVFLAPDGRPLLSVPYEIGADELAWCFVTAQRRADPAWEGAMPASARMPRRVVLGAVYDPGGAFGGAVQPVTRKELAELIREVKKGLDFEEHAAHLRRILHSDLSDALEFIQVELRSSGTSAKGAGAGATGGGTSGLGGGGGGSAAGGGGNEKHARILHAMGAVSPPAYWELAADFLGHADPAVRGEAVVALEQLAAPEAVKDLQERLRKERDPKVAKDLIRALAACGAADAKVRKQVLQSARKEKDALLKLNAIAALGLLDPHADVDAAIEEILDGGTDDERRAALCAAALTRDARWLPRVEALEAAGDAPEVGTVAAAAALVLRGESLRHIQKPLWIVCQDQIPRERLFGKADG